MSEERTCNSEDTQPCSFKAFFALGRLLHWLNVLIHSTHDCWRVQRQNVLSSLWKVCSSLMTYVQLRNPGSTIIFLARRNHIHHHCPIASRSDHLRLGSSCRRLDSTQMDKLGSFGRRWILGVRRVTV